MTETTTDKAKRQAEAKRRFVEAQKNVADVAADFWQHLNHDAEGNIECVWFGEWMKLQNASSEFFWARHNVKGKS